MRPNGTIRVTPPHATDRCLSLTAYLILNTHHTRYTSNPTSASASENASPSKNTPGSNTTACARADRCPHSHAATAIQSNGETRTMNRNGEGCARQAFTRGEGRDDGLVQGSRFKVQGWSRITLNLEP